MFCELCNWETVNGLMYKIKDRYICSDCYDKLEEANIHNEIEDKE